MLGKLLVRNADPFRTKLICEMHSEFRTKLSEEVRIAPVMAPDLALVRIARCDMHTNLVHIGASSTHQIGRGRDC